MTAQADSASPAPFHQTLTRVCPWQQQQKGLAHWGGCRGETVHPASTAASQSCPSRCWYTSSRLLICSWTEKDLPSHFWRGMEKILWCQREIWLPKRTHSPAQICHPPRTAVSHQSSLWKAVLPMELLPIPNALIFKHIHMRVYIYAWRQKFSFLLICSLF